MLNLNAPIEGEYEPRPQFVPFHARAHRFAVMVCHRRAGKTVACINDIIDKAIQCKKFMPRFSYVGPQYKQVKALAWDYLKHYAKPLLAGPPMESELKVRLINGAEIRLFGADNPDALRGLYHDGVILDEYGDMSPRVFNEIILPALLDRKGWVVFIGTPKGPNHFKTVWKEASRDPMWFHFMLKASESGILDQADLAMARNAPGMDQATYDQEFECSFDAAVRGAYYGEMLNELEKQGRMGIFGADPELQVHTAWDIGYTDDTSIWFYQTDGKHFKHVDFFTGSGYSVDDVVYELRERGHNYGQFWLPHDARNKNFQTGKSVVELLRGHGIRAQIVPSLSVQDGIQAVRATLPYCFFNVGNENVRELGLNALRMYQRKWDDKNQIFRAEPLHDWASNPADAFRMFALAMNKHAVARGAQSLVQRPLNERQRQLNLENLYDDRKITNINRGNRI